MLQVQPGNDPVTWSGRMAEPWSAVPRRPLLELLGPALAAHAEPVLVFDDGVEITGPRLLDRIERFAGVLATRIDVGERVLLACGNRAEFLVAYFAILANRGVVVAVSPDIREHDAEHALAGARCVLAIAEPDAAVRIDAIAPRAEGLREVLRIDGPEPAGLAHLENDATRPLRLADVDADIEDLVDIGFTSGTTGLPKALGGNHSEPLRYVDVALRAEPPAPDERVMLGLQFHYGDPLYSFIAAALSGTSVLVMRRFSVSRFWTTAKAYRATRIVTIGSIPNLLLTAPPSPADRDHGVRRALGVGIPKDLHAELEARFGFPWHEGYGSSESGPVIAMPPEAAPRYVGTGALGVPYPDVEARLVDPDGATLDGPALGELELSGAIVFRGYQDNEEATAEVLHDGWLRTGDLMRRDADGVYYFEGRRKELIRRGGENVAPAEVEAVLRLHPAVIDVAVVPVADPIQGEEIKAYIQVHEDADVAPEALTDFCAERLARFKVPRYVALRTEPFPRTPSQRIKKELLKVDGAHRADDSWDRTTPVA